MAEELDIAIIGAGAAGIAAGKRLATSGLSYLILEAMDRLGGRALTRSIDGISVDLGCGWLHSADRNPWTCIAREEGFTLDKTMPAWGTQFADLGFDRADQAASAKAYEAFERRLRECPPPTDRAADALDPSEKWNSAIEARSSYINGVALDGLSICDYLAYADCDTGINWRLPQGYGALIASAAVTLPIRLATAVDVIDRRGAPLRLMTATGIIRARTAIVTVPTSCLAGGGLRILPEDEDLLEAVHALPLGLADKVFLRLQRPEEIDPDSHMLGDPRRTETGSYYLRPFGNAVIECFFGGNAAKMLEREGESGMAAFAISELVELFGSGMRKRLDPLVASGWGRLASIAGSYSHATPGRAAMRSQLGRPIEDRIFFAGEACSPTDFSTAHGAYVTGRGAAEAAIATLQGAFAAKLDEEDEENV